MNGVLGGFKNMLRRWRINLKQKKKKKLTEEKYKKITKYPRLTSFIYSAIALIYSPFGYIFAKSNDQAELEKPKLYKKIEEINIKLDKIIIGEENNIKKIEKEIEKLKEEVKKPMSIETKNYFNNKLKEIEIKTNFIKNPNKISTIEAKIISDSLKQNIANKNINKPKNINRPLLKKLAVIPIALAPEYQKQIKSISNGIQTKSINNELNFIKDANTQFNETEQKIKEIKMKIPTIKEYNHYYDLENDLKYLYQKINLLKCKYVELKNKFNANIELDFDKYKLIKSDNKITEILDEIENDLKLIEIKKEELLTKKVIKEEQKKAEKKEEKKKEAKTKIKEIDEFVEAKNHVLNNIINQNKYLENYFQKLAKSTNKKKTIFSSLFNFSKTILNFTISLLPVSIFKNKLLGSLVSTIMINNSIKTMRKMVNPKLNINYELFLESYMSNKDIIISTYNICNSSLNELSLLKDELILLGASKEAKDLLNQIEAIENNILKQMENLKMKNQTLDKVYVKIKKDAA